MTKLFPYSQSEFNVLLSLFQRAIDDGKYTEKIPYETWRKLKKLSGFVEIEYEKSFVRIRDCFIRADGTETRDIVYSAKIYDWGFGRFFYDYVIKKENDQMTLNSATSAVSASNIFDATKISALESKRDYLSVAEVAAYTTSLSGKAACDYNGYSYYGTDSTDAAKIAGTPINDTTTLNDLSIGSDYANTISADRYANNWVGITDMCVRKDEFDALQKKVDKVELEILKNRNNKCENKENNTMMKGFNFDFGPCGNTVRLSMYGLAVQNVSGEWVSYNTTTKEIMNVDIINMADGGKYIYKMPVAISEVQVGDIIVHAKVPMFVTGINNDGSFNAIDVRAGEAKCILATRSPFGFNFVTKVVNLFGNMLGTPTADQPFGNMLPLLMLSGENKDIDPMMMFFLMGQNGNTPINPMMWYFLSKDNKDMDPAMMWMVMSMAGGATPGFMAQPYTCKCHQKVSDEQI